MYAAVSPEELGPASSRAEEEGLWRQREGFFFEKTSRSTATSYKEKERASSYNL
jgi:hypothetical protein